MSGIDLYQTLLRSSLHWPKHWRTTIGRVEYYDVHTTFERKYIVTPLDPEWVHYYTVRGLGELVQPHDGKMYLDPIEFDSLEQMDNWAKVTARLSK